MLFRTNRYAASDIHQKYSGMGGLIRDAEGEVLLSFSSITDYTTNPALAESLALRKAMDISIETGFYRLIFECDCSRSYTQSTPQKSASRN